MEKFKQLLSVDNNLIIFGDSELEKFVWEYRQPENTQFIKRELDWFKNEFYDKIQKIRTNPSWYNQSELRERLGHIVRNNIMPAKVHSIY